MRGYIPGIAFRTEPSAGGESPPAEPPAPEPTPPEEPSAAPWANDLAQAFEDPEQRQSVDAFLRSNVQPHVTQLEQQLADRPEEAVRLYQDFAQAPDATFFQVAEELYGEEIADYLYQQLAERANAAGEPGTVEGTAAEVTEPGEPPAEPAEPAEVPEDVQLATSIVLEQEEERAFKAAVSEVADDLFPEHVVKDTDARERLLAPFVATAEGDMEAATQAYKEWAGLLEKGEVTPEQAAEAAAEGLTPAAVPDPLAGGTTPAVPQQEQHESIGDAIDSWLAEERAAKAPPPVGGV